VVNSLLKSCSSEVFVKNKGISINTSILVGDISGSHDDI
jgi:hypothetical protein